MKKAYLVLENGSVFEGQAVGAEGNALGEMVFTTGVVGYLETLTDPNHAGQIVMQTFPCVGNYGVINEDIPGICAVAGYVAREICDTPSNFRCDGTLDQYLKACGVPGICGVDTRELTRVIREEGEMKALICAEIPADISAVASLSPVEITVGAAEQATYPAKGAGKYSVALIDYGFGRGVLDELTGRGCDVTIYPGNTDAETIRSAGHDGVVLSDGPGDPAEKAAAAENIRRVTGDLPVLGIGLGHQLMAIAMGGRTGKLRTGHRGANYPVRDTLTGRSYITAQNTGYTVLKESLGENAVVCFTGGSDGGCEGVMYPGKQLFSVQFRPRTEKGPNSTGFVFEKFIEMMGENGNAKR